MPAHPGIRYRCYDDHMGKVLMRACPKCGAAVGELCISRTGKWVTNIVNVHTARFRDPKQKKRSHIADHYAAL